MTRPGWIDVTRPLGPATPVWPGDRPWSLEWTAVLGEGSPANVGAITGTTHGGTHVDAPLHAIAGGAAVSELPIDAFAGPAVVVDVSDPARPDAAIDPDEVDPGDDARRVLLKTGCDWSGGIPTAFRAPSAATARRLAERGVRLVGTDAPSIDPPGSETLDAHVALLSRGIPVVESLSLAGIEPGRYELLALPLRLEGADGSPVRAALRPLDPRRSR